MLSMGSREIDNQHKDLFKLGHLLAQQMQDPATGIEQFHSVLNDIAKSVRDHFATEEKILARNGYPLLAVHSLAHRDYLETLGNILTQAALKNPDNTALLEMVFDLVSKHFLEMDLPCKNFMKDEHQ